jgi:hypothetical protein
LRRADHSSKAVISSVLIRIRNLRCEAAKVLARTVGPLMMMQKKRKKNKKKKKKKKKKEEQKK